MNFRNVLVAIALSISSVILIAPPSAAALTCAQGGACVVGDTGPGGGKVFFVKATGSFSKSYTVIDLYDPSDSITYSLSLTSGEQSALAFDYLEVAPTQSGSIVFGTNGLITGGTSTLIGTGASNTTKIIATLTSDTAANNAAYYADAYSNSGKSDWFLPSYDELLLIMILSLESDSSGPNIGSFPDGLWSSTTNDVTSARYSARNQLSGDVTKGAAAKAVAIRSFSASVIDSSSNKDSDAENQQKRQKALDEARSAILNKVNSGGNLSRVELQAAEEPALSELMIFELNNRLLILNPSIEIEYSEIAFLIARYRNYDQIIGNSFRRTYSQDLITYGVIGSSYPMKSLALHRLMGLPLQERDSVLKIDTFLLAEAERTANLKARLLARSR